MPYTLSESDLLRLQGYRVGNAVKMLYNKLQKVSERDSENFLEQLCEASYLIEVRPGLLIIAVNDIHAGCTPNRKMNALDDICNALCTNKEFCEAVRILVEPVS